MIECPEILMLVALIGKTKISNELLKEELVTSLPPSIHPLSPSSRMQLRE
jgi:hypothetical protein